MKTIAAVGEPVGLNANWSENERVGGGEMKTGWGKCWTTVRSITLVKTGVMEMGRKSACCVGAETLVIGRMQACFHCCGTVDVAMDRLKSRAIGL